MPKQAPLPSQVQRPNGLHLKFHLQKIVGYLKTKPMYADIGNNEEYFVLRLDDECPNKPHLEACRLAAAAYANAIESTHPEVAADMRKRWLNH